MKKSILLFLLFSGFSRLTMGQITVTSSANGIVFSGFESGSLGAANVFLGARAGHSNVLVGDIFVGNRAGEDNTIGRLNTFVGASAGRFNITGQENVYLGTSAGRSNTNGSYNTYLGRMAGYTSTTGSYNTLVGYKTNFLGNGLSNSTILGYQAGYQAGYNETGSNKLYIANSNTTTPLIYGDFQEDRVNITNKLGINIGINDPTANLHNKGNVRFEDLPSIDLAWALAIDNDGYVYKTGVAIGTVIPMTEAVMEENAQLKQELTSLENRVAQLEAMLINKTQKEVEQAVLYQNKPNPSNHDVEIPMLLPQNANSVELYIYDMQGNQLDKILLNQRGKFTFSLSISKFRAGLYNYALVIDGAMIDVKKMIITE